MREFDMEGYNNEREQARQNLYAALRRGDRSALEFPAVEVVEAGNGLDEKLVILSAYFEHGLVGRRYVAIQGGRVETGDGSDCDPLFEISRALVALYGYRRDRPQYVALSLNEADEIAENASDEKRMREARSLVERSNETLPYNPDTPAFCVIDANDRAAIERGDVYAARGVCAEVGQIAAHYRDLLAAAT